MYQRTVVSIDGWFFSRSAVSRQAWRHLSQQNQAHATVCRHRALTLQHICTYVQYLRMYSTDAACTVCMQLKRCSTYVRKCTRNVFK